MRNTIIVYGTYDLILDEDENIYAYTRTQGDETFRVVCNFSSKTQDFKCRKNINYESSELIIANYDDSEKLTSSFILKPYEARAYLLK